MDIEKSIKRTLRIMIIWSAAAVVSLPIMIVALNNPSNGLEWIIAAPCLAILGISFYGLPIGWTIGYAPKLKMARVVNTVNDGVLSIADICAVTGYKPKALLPVLHTLLGKKYLTGYKFNADKTALEKLEKIEVIKPRAKKCQNCGGVLTREDNVCEYCGLRN